MNNHLPQTPEKQVLVKKYGRNVEKLILQVATTTQRTEQQPYINALIDLLAIIDKETDRTGSSPEQYQHHLMVLSNYQFNTDTPHQTENDHPLQPQTLKNQHAPLHFSCCGYNLTQLIHKTVHYLQEKTEHIPHLLPPLIHLMQSIHQKSNPSTMLIHLEEVAQQKLPLKQSQLEQLLPTPHNSKNRNHRKRNYRRKERKNSS